MLCSACEGIGTLELNNGDLLDWAFFFLGVISHYQWIPPRIVISCMLDSRFLFVVYTSITKGLQLFLNKIHMFDIVYYSHYWKPNNMSGQRTNWRSLSPGNFYRLLPFSFIVWLLAYVSFNLSLSLSISFYMCVCVCIFCLFVLFLVLAGFYVLWYNVRQELERKVKMNLKMF